MSFSNVGKRWSEESFQTYLGTLTPASWCKGVTLHHTSSPSLAQRPYGLSPQHVINIEDFYENTKGWRSGPQLFVDGRDIIGMTPLTSKGVHAVSFNSSMIGIEVLGDYDSEDPFTGRGIQCWRQAAATTGMLLKWLKVPVNSSTVTFHRDDPKTSKTCPGAKVKKDWVLGLIESTKPVGVTPQPADPLYIGPIVEVVDYISGKMGISYGAAAKRFSRSGKLYLFDGKWIEGAYYNSQRETTMAPAAEIDEVLASAK